MALILQFFHIFRLSILPFIWYKVQLITGDRHHIHDLEDHTAEGEAGGHWLTIWYLHQQIHLNHKRTNKHLLTHAGSSAIELYWLSFHNIETMYMSEISSAQNRQITSFQRRVLKFQPKDVRCFLRIFFQRAKSYKNHTKSTQRLTTSIVNTFAQIETSILNYDIIQFI